MEGSNAPTGTAATGGISDVQQHVIFILFGTSGAISVFGASFLCYFIYISTKSNALSPRHRILFGLSFFDFLASCRNCVVGYHGVYHRRTEPGAMCTLSGYLNYITVSAPLYNLLLALYYCLTIRSGVSQNTFANKYEKWGHAIAILYPFILGTVGLLFKIYNPGGNNQPGCIATPYPYACTLNDDVECRRGRSALVFLFATLLEKRSQRFNLSDDRVKKTRKVAIQCFLYVFVFFLTWIWTVVNMIIEFTDYENFENGKYYPMLVLEHFFYPSQGAGNLVVYLSPIYRQLRDSGYTRCEALSHLILVQAPHVDGLPRPTLLAGGGQDSSLSFRPFSGRTSFLFRQSLRNDQQQTTTTTTTTSGQTTVDPNEDGSQKQQQQQPITQEQVTQDPVIEINLEVPSGTCVIK